MENDSNKNTRIENYNKILDGLFDLIILRSQEYTANEEREFKSYARYLLNTCDLIENTLNKNYDLTIPTDSELPF